MSLQRDNNGPTDTQGEQALSDNEGRCGSYAAASPVIAKNSGKCWKLNGRDDYNAS